MNPRLETSSRPSSERLLLTLMYVLLACAFCCEHTITLSRATAVMHPLSAWLASKPQFFHFYSRVLSRYSALGTALVVNFKLMLYHFLR